MALPSDDLRKKLEAELMAKAKANGPITENMAFYIDGYLAALDLLWPAVVACEFYANDKNWIHTDDSLNYKAPGKLVKSWTSCGYEFDADFDDGHIATAALEKIGGAE